jgi:hypothetical protein
MKTRSKASLTKPKGPLGCVSDFIHSAYTNPVWIIATLVMVAAVPYLLSTISSLPQEIADLEKVQNELLDVRSDLETIHSYSVRHRNQFKEFTEIYKLHRDLVRLVLIDGNLGESTKALVAVKERTVTLIKELRTFGAELAGVRFHSERSKQFSDEIERMRQELSENLATLTKFQDAHDALGEGKGLRFAQLSTEWLHATSAELEATNRRTADAESTVRESETRKRLSDSKMSEMYNRQNSIEIRSRLAEASVLYIAGYVVVVGVAVFRNCRRRSDRGKKAGGAKRTSN